MGYPDCYISQNILFPQQPWDCSNNWDLQILGWERRQRWVNFTCLQDMFALSMFYFFLPLLNTLCWQIALCCLNLFKVDYAREKAISCLRLKYAMSNVLQHPLPCVRLITRPRGKEKEKQTDKESKPCEELEGKSFPAVTTVIHTYILYIFIIILIFVFMKIPVVGISAGSPSRPTLGFHSWSVWML